MEKSLSSQKSKIAQILFWIAFISLILIRSLNSAGVDIPFRTRLMQLMAVLFGIKILLTHYSLKEWIIIGATAIITGLAFLTAKDTLWIEIAVMLIAAKDMDLKQCCKVYFTIAAVSMVAMMVLSGIGVIDNFKLVQDFDRGGVETRYAFGYTHPNVFFSNVMNVVALGILAFYDKIKPWHLAVLTGLNIVFLLLSVSRTGFIVVQVLLISVFIVKVDSKLMESKIVYGIGYLCISLAVLLSYSVYFLDWKYLALVNKLTTGRIFISLKYAHFSDWTILPATREDIVLDMGFVHVMFYWGILLGLVYIGLILWNYRRLYLKKDAAALVILLSYTLFTMVESHGFSMFFVGNLMFILMIGWGKERNDVSTEKSNS